MTQAIILKHSNNTDTLWLCIAILLWMLSPLWGTSLCLTLLFFQRFRYKNILILLINLFIALLAYTQKSKALDGTDIIRYYEIINTMIEQNQGSGEYLKLLYSSQVPIFYLVSIYVVKLTGNIQFVSFFWCLVSYSLYFLFVRDIVECIKLNYKKNIGEIVLFSIFGLLLFVQITETIKQAAAMSIFFYALSSFLRNKNRLYIFTLVLLALGIHNSTILLLPLFFCQHIKSWKWIQILFLVILISPIVDFAQFITSITTFRSGLLGLIHQQTTSYVGMTGQESTIRYILIFLVIVGTNIYHMRKGYRPDFIINISILYVMIAFLNYNNSTVFVRMAHFCHHIALLTFLPFLKRNLSSIEGKIKVTYICFFVVFTLRLTIGRTIGDGYTCSYVDNSIYNLCTYNIIDYLSFEAY